MKVYAVINQWGRYMPIYFDECCTAMTAMYDPEKKPYSGFWLNNSNGKIIEFAGGKPLGLREHCPFCGKKNEVEVIRRLKESEA